MSRMHQEFVNEAVEMAAKNAENYQGGPFGALIVKDGEVIGRGVNRVTTINDPTAHAEVMAIRDACQRIGDFSLEGAVIYTSCEPCPMCLSAIYWARLSRIYYAAQSDDAAKAGFDDSFIYKELSLPAEKRTIPKQQVKSDIARKPFDTWIAMEDKTEY